MGNGEDGKGCGVILIITTEFLERTEEYHEKLRPGTRYCDRDFTWSLSNTSVSFGL